MISAQNLSKSYGPTLAVDDLSFDVRPGVVTGFLGPNGAGKSTTMRLILGLDAPTKGRVTVNGRPYRSLHSPLHEVGALLEARGIHPGRSARNHLLCLARSNGIPSRRVDDVLEAVGLANVARRRAGGFSLGMGQRLGLAAALLGDPPVLLLDEPVNGLDPEGIIWIRNLLRSLAAEGRTILLSSHLMSEMAVTADHLLVIGRGRLMADTTVEEFIRANTVGTVRVRSPRPDELVTVLGPLSVEVTIADDGALLVSGTDPATIGEAAAAAGIALHELVEERGSLEAAYLELTQDDVEYRPDEAAAAALTHARSEP